MRDSIPLDVSERIVVLEKINRDGEIEEALVMDYKNKRKLTFTAAEWKKEKSKWL